MSHHHSRRGAGSKITKAVVQPSRPWPQLTIRLRIASRAVSVNRKVELGSWVNWTVFCWLQVVLNVYFKLRDTVFGTTVETQSCGVHLVCPVRVCHHRLNTCYFGGGSPVLVERPKTCRSEWTYCTDRYPNPIHPSLTNRKRFLWTLSQQSHHPASSFRVHKARTVTAGHQPLWPCQSLELATPCTCRRAGLRNYRNAVQPRPGSSVRGHEARVVTADISDYADYVTEVSPTACSSTGCLFAISWIFYVPSTAQASHLRTNHTLTVTPYQVETQVTNTSKKLAHGSTYNTINRKRIQANSQWLAHLKSYISLICCVNCVL